VPASAPPPRPPRTPLSFLRAGTFGVLSFLITFLGFIAATAALVVNPRSARLSNTVARIWSRAILAISGCRLRVEGVEHFRPDVPRMLVANHASWLDPAALLVAFPGELRYVLKRELLAVPFIGLFCRLGGHFIIDRSDPRAGQALLERAVSRARRHRISPLVFPEGTRTHDGRLGPLRAGSFQLALCGGFDVQPIAVLGTFAIMPRGAAFPWRRGEVVVRAAPAIPIAGLDGGIGRKVLAARVREALVSLGVPDGSAGPGDE
jgi:1-acyl-sn-glycerol-3-phosphate acyltransferase